MSLCALALVCFLPLSALSQSNDQTNEQAALVRLVNAAYDAYRKKDEQALLSLSAESSPFFNEFKESMRREFVRNEKLKLELKRVLVLRVGVQGERARIRVVVNMSAFDKATGQPAEDERFREWDHLLYLRREGGVWKLWKFIDTAEEFANVFLAAKTSDAREKIVAERSQIMTVGLERGLQEQGRTLLEVKGDFQSALLILELALKFAEQLKDVEGRGGALVAIGDVHSAQGEYARAAEVYQRVMKLSEVMGIKWGVAAMLIKIGNIHYNQGDHRQALDYYQKSVKLYEELGSTLEIAYALASLGNAQFSQRDYQQALANYQRSLKIYERIFDRAGTAYLLDRIGAVMAELEKYEQAVEYHERSLKLYEAMGNRAMMAYSLNSVSNVRYRQGRAREAAALSSRAADLARASNSLETLWQALTSQGHAYRLLKQHTEARDAYAEAITVIEKLRGQAAGNEQDQQLFFESKTAPFLAMVELSLAQGDAPAALVYAERAKGRMLFDVLRNGRANITKSLTAQEQEQERSLNGQLIALNAALRRERLQSAPDQTRLAQLETRLQQARLEYDAYQTQLYASHPDLKMQRGEAAPLSPNEAASLLPDTKTILLEYVVTDEKTYLFTLSRKSNAGDAASGDVALKVYTINASNLEINALVKDFRRRLAQNSLDFKEAARHLYELVLRPAQKELDGKGVVCIIPSGELWELPFQALLSQPDRYFLEDHALFYAPSLSVLREIKRLRPLQDETASQAGNPLLVKTSLSVASQGQSLLALGNPSLSADVISRSKSASRDFSLGALPEAEREVKALGEIYGTQRSKILTGAAAREETVKTEAAKYPILHFATHATLDNAAPLYSHLLLASSSEQEDGFLEAREIMKLDLHADLVVLSACETARGSVRPGEGLIGMSWALFIAGTSTTVASQWAVDSASTARLMVEFHRQLQQSNRGTARTGKAEALRRAATQLMTDPKYRHPFFWSGFVVLGDGM
ncbi:MAG TPA: CHAT domain-containing protein [Pyrinomonadaceae bacterium]|nr:CHAT domain-containing protein [Pyrinomonadaceae bacterium]